MRSFLSLVVVVAVCGMATAADAPLGMKPPTPNHVWGKIDGAGGDFGGYGWKHVGGPAVSTSCQCGAGVAVRSYVGTCANGSCSYPTPIRSYVLPATANVFYGVGNLISPGGCANGRCNK